MRLQLRLARPVLSMADGALPVPILAAREIIPAIIQHQPAAAQPVRVQALAQITPTAGTKAGLALVMPALAHKRKQWNAGVATDRS